MSIDAAIELADGLLYEKTGQHLNDLQCCILRQAWGGKTYSAIAAVAGYSEGHVKDVASQLWRLLSEALGERITKGNYRSRLRYWLQRAKHRVEQKMVSAAEKFASVADPLAESSPAVLNLHFVGRADAIAALDRLVAQGHRVIVIQGEGGVGKTTLAQHYLRTHQFDRQLELLMAKETANITAIERIVEEWLRQDFNEEPGRDFGVTLERLKRQLRQQRVGILIDNLEPALDAQGQLVAPHRRYVELLRLLADAQGRSMTLVTSRDRLCEPGIKVYHYRLPGLTLASWHQFFSAQAVSLTEPALQSLHQAYSGNAKAMEILCGTVQSDFEGDLATYWQVNQTDLLVETDLKNLVVNQINRIQQLDSCAYQLLCRLSCYRYQALPKLPIEAVLAMLWDVAAAQQRQIITSLRNRSLLETSQGKYWLHPVVRAVAIARLRLSDDWEPANQAAAQYWTQSITQIITLPDALQALEAYYHHLNIQAVEAAAEVLLKSRNNQWHQFLPLASSLYRMGLLQPVIAAITQVLSALEAEASGWPKRSELLNLLGDVYWITGRIEAAIVCQEQVMTSTEIALGQDGPADSVERYYLKMLNVDSRLSIGLYKVDLGELNAAKAQLAQVIALAEGTPHAAWAEKAAVALALVDAKLGHDEQARATADRLYSSFVSSAAPEQSGRFAYFILLLGQTYSHLGERAIAFALYQKAIAFADAGHYLQVKAKALTGLAICYRQQGALSEALAYHQQSIELLEAIGATCDLAEAYYECALTQQASSPQQAATAQQRAVALFTQINAPHRIQQVSGESIPILGLASLAAAHDHPACESVPD
ncbi:MAG: tetratricopeptide repeat protein [Leptolyngbya sp. SIO4C1]|nr:tetratricopeptide repeat protein [Leptolyngbya sp. SIO4C1]